MNGNMKYAEVSNALIGAAINVHRELGPGLLESAYQRCMELELESLGIPFESQVPVPVRYRGVVFEDQYVADLVVADKIVVELKAVSKLAEIHKAQLDTYMKFLGKSVGYLLNFNVPVISRDGRVRLFRDCYEQS